MPLPLRSGKMSFAAGFGQEPFMLAAQRPVVAAVLSQHLEDAASIRNVRSVLLSAPHVELHRLARLDERLEAHLDGLLVAGDAGYRLALGELDRPSAGQLFTVAVLALHRRDMEQISRLLALAEVVPELPRALASAMGWVSAPALRGWTGPLLASNDPWWRWLGLAACTAHRVDPGDSLLKALDDADPSAPHTALAVRAAGLLGRVDMLPRLLERVRSADADSAFRDACATSAVLLGDRGVGLDALRSATLAGGSDFRSMQLYLLAAPASDARAFVRELAAVPAPLRSIIRASAWAGDVRAVPWLIKHMADPAYARVAGEAFSTLTGADLARQDLEIKGPQPAAPGGPSDDTESGDVALDEDESLPWPDVKLVQAWWEKHARVLTTIGRAFVGAEVSQEQCIHVLELAGQRQRYAAARLMSLLAPGTPVFTVAAPSRRQQQSLRAMHSTDTQGTIHDVQALQHSPR